DGGAPVIINEPDANNLTQFCVTTSTWKSSYVVTLRVIGVNASITSEATSNVTAAPIAGFTATPITVQWGDSVAFTNTTQGLATGWSWDFDTSDGIGTDNTSQHPTRTYNGTLGPKTIRLTASGPGGS